MNRRVVWIVAVAWVSAAIGCGADSQQTDTQQTDAQPTDVQSTDHAAGDAADAGDDASDVPLPTYHYDGEPGPPTLFSHGVASGDPLSDRVILWTRVTLAEERAAGAAVPVFWEMATDPGFAEVTHAGWADATAERDFTVHVDADALHSATTYYYRFRSMDRSSPIGRTRTAPDAASDGLGGDSSGELRIAVASCSGAAAGWFHGYRSLAERADVDAVLHLGDYIYEYGDTADAVRNVAPHHECVTLADYRSRYAAYREDADLQEAHRQHPFIVVWDDHETADNAWMGGSPNHDPATEGTWDDRVAAAQQAYLEWMPIRAQPEGRLWRSFPMGGLVDLFMLDTRIWGREEPVYSANDPVMKLATRQLLGADQEAWLLDGIANSAARWTLIGQQVVMGQFRVLGAPLAEGGGVPLNPDQWDGYPATRQRLFDAMAARTDHNFAVLSGDIHTSFAMELTPDPSNPAAYDSVTGAGSLGVEVVAPGITSRGLDGGATLLPLLTDENPHLKWGEFDHRGYVVLRITPEALQADWWFVDDVLQVESTVNFGKAFVTVDGQNHWVEAFEPMPESASAPELAPRAAPGGP